MRFADPIDMAADLAARSNDAAIEEARYRARPEQEQNPDGTWPTTECVDCGSDLGERLTLGKIRCVVCQENLEKRKSQYAR